jgi:serine/threonine protein kinase
VADFVGDERFRVVRQLGSGGMGVVYEAQDVRENVRVALKTMRAVHPGALLRFKTEFRALADLAHPNLATLHELHLDGPEPYFTMELVRGVDFLSYVRGQDARTEAQPFASTVSSPSEPKVASGGLQARTVRSTERRFALDVDRLRAALKQLALGVQTLHDAGKLHRDLKPSNVLVTQEGRVVILDFGLVADIDPAGMHASDHDAPEGTAEYMSPEQASCTRPAEPSDWYSFGSMLYEALAEQFPYLGTRFALLCAKQTTDPVPPSLLREGVPEDLERLAMELLRRDPAERPTGPRVLERLGVVRAPMAAPNVTSRPGTSHAPFVGRAAQVAALQDAFANVVNGRPTTVHVRGASGMGKSYLVRRTIDDFVSAHGKDVVVLSGRCYEQESVPYKAVDSVIDALSRYLRSLKKEDAATLLPSNVRALERLFPVLRRVEAIAMAPRRAAEMPDPHEVRRRAFGALREMLTRIAERTPLIVWIDDLQWGDVDSGMLLGELLRPPDPPPLLFVVSYRSEAEVAVGCLAALRRVAEGAGGAETSTLDIDALTPADAQRLAATLLEAAGDRNGAMVESIADESAGNPFLLAELVRFHQSGVGARPARSGKTHLEDVLDARLEQCGEGARLLLELVAVAGRPIALDVAAAAAEMEPAVARTAVAQLRAAQLVRRARVRDHDGLDTYHDRVRETVPRILEEGALVKRHARLVAAIEASRDPDPEALATHCIAAGYAVRAGEYAAKAGEQAVATLAFDRASEWFQRSIEWRALDANAARDLRRKRADSLAAAGRGADAGREYLRAAEGLSGHEGTELRRRAAAELLTSGRIDEGVSVVREVLASIDASYPPTPRLAFLLFLITTLWLRVRGYEFTRRDERVVSPLALHRIDTFRALTSGLVVSDNVRGRYFTNRFCLAALKVGEPRRAAIALATQIANASAFGTTSEARVRRLERRLAELASDLANAEVTAYQSMAAAWVTYFFGRFEEALPVLTQASASFRASVPGSAWERDTMEIFAVSSLWFLGRIRDLRARVADLREDAVRRGDPYLTAMMGIGDAANARLAGDEPERSVREVTDVFEAWPEVANDVPRYYAFLACAQAELYQGRGESALARTRAVWPHLRRTFLLHMQITRVTSTHVLGRAAVSTLRDRPADKAARRDAERAIRSLSGEKFPYASALSLSLAASLAHHDGRSEEAIRLYGEAASAFTAHSMALYAAACRYRQGGLLGGDEGAALVAAAEEQLRSETVKDPARMVEMLVPAGRA